MFLAMTDTQRKANVQQEPLGAHAKDAQFEHRIAVDLNDS